MANPHNRNLYEYATPMLKGLQHSIHRPTV
ncbi:uncharacterized protein G2W53_035127 [Senna tora]|uniref:Uncharacterized protein n=1 Tax=Senna tora TaxID=362788 RepID=A0A834W8Y2_9FABA|nr:uncharacterized protein G2W53_035127 [Senna tora]